MDTTLRSQPGSYEFAIAITERNLLVIDPYIHKSLSQKTSIFILFTSEFIVIGRISIWNFVSMSNSVYNINKGINKPVEFRGLKAQYIWYLGGGLVLLLIVFAALYICGVNIFFCLALIIILATLLFIYVYKLSREYGQYGLMKKIAGKSVPRTIKNYSSRIFVQ